MKRMFFLLFSLLGLMACTREADELSRRGDESSETMVPVRMELSGDLNLPQDGFDENGKALSLVPGTNGAGKAVLKPQYQDGDQVDALINVTRMDGWVTSSHPIQLKAIDGGKKFTFRGDVPIPANLNGRPLRVSIFVGPFRNTARTSFSLTSRAPAYSPSNATTITNYPLIFQAKANITPVSKTVNGQTVNSYSNLSLRYTLVGALLRCRLKNETSQAVTVTGLQLCGLGAQHLVISTPRAGKAGSSLEPFVTSDYTDPSESGHIYNLPQPLTLQPGQTDGSYLVYAPLVSEADGRKTEYAGYIRPILNDASQQALYGDVQAPKVLTADRTGTISPTVVRIAAWDIPVRPNAIPLQYFNLEMFYKPGGTPSTVPYLPHYLRASNRTVPMGLIFEGVAPFPAEAFYFRPRSINPAEVDGVDPKLHVPTLAELQGIFPSGMIEPKESDGYLPVYYKDYGTYTSDGIETIEVGGGKYAGKSQYWRKAIDPAMPQEAMRQLVWQGSIPTSVPIYALRFGKLTDSEVATLRGQGLTDKEIATTDKGRVAYMYYFHTTRVEIFSCYIGEDESIKTAQDLYEKEVFMPKTSEYGHTLISGTRKGRTIYLRGLRRYGALYSSPDVDGGRLQFPQLEMSSHMSTYILRDLNRVYGSYANWGRYEPITSSASLLIPSPACGLLYRDPSVTDSLKAVWYWRGDEGLTSPAIPDRYKMAWKYKDTKEDGPVTSYYPNELPPDGSRHYAFPLYFLSKDPSTTVIKNVFP